MHTTQTSLAQLAATCTDELPTEELLLAAARCSGWTPGVVGGSAPPCASGPCLNGATCTDAVQAFTCSCATGYIGTTCDTIALPCCSDCKTLHAMPKRS